MIGFVFTGDGFGSDEIVKLIKVVLPKLKDAGADVIAVVCDEVSYNYKTFSTLGSSPTNLTFKLNGVEYFALFDWPHLIKRLLYQMRTHLLIYNGKEVVANFDDIKNTWEVDKAGQSELLSHLDSSHFAPNAFQAMNVKRAFQLLSNRVASSIITAGEAGQRGVGLKSKTWKKTAHFAKTMNDVIDACNSYYLKSKNPLKRPLSDRNPETQKRLEDFLHWS